MPPGIRYVPGLSDAGAVRGKGLLVAALCVWQLLLQKRPAVDLHQ
jgi:hypothetical protein